MVLASFMEPKVDLQLYQTPSLNDYNNADSIPPNTVRNSGSFVVVNNADQPLYNAEMYGSLRKGNTVSFFSKDCIGLVAATFASAFSLECLNNMIEPLLKDDYKLEPVKLAAIQRLSSLPLAFCFFFGLLSDCYPILGFRRKGYLIIGLVTTSLSLFAFSALVYYVETRDHGSAGTGSVVGIIVVATSASTGIMFTDMCVHTRVLELSQREKLSTRGAIIATYSMFRFVVYLITDACLYATRIHTTSHRTSLIIFGILIGLSILLVWKIWQEKYYSLSTPIKTRSQILWKVMQQKAVWRIIMFMSFFTFFGTITFTAPDIYISVGSETIAEDKFVDQALYNVAVVFTIAVWRYCFMNRPWRTFFAASTVMLIVPRIILAIFVTKDIIRRPYFYHLMTFLSNIAHGIAWLAGVVPLTEIIQEGSEGAMVGLILSTYYLVTMFVQANSTGFLSGDVFYSSDIVALDNVKRRSESLNALLVCYAINSLQFVALFFLPRQKLDTQQLRSYGGYTKCASAAIVTVAVAFFVYTVTITTLTLYPSTSCLWIVGGNGC